MATAHNQNPSISVENLSITPNWEKGAITAEFATTLPAVMMLFAVVIAFAAAFGTQFRVSDAARTGARLAAIGHDTEDITSHLTTQLGGSPQVHVRRDEAWAAVEVRQSLRVGPLWLGPLAVSATATSWVEP